MFFLEPKHIARAGVEDWRVFMIFLRESFTPFLSVIFNQEKLSMEKFQVDLRPKSNYWN